MKNFPHQFNDIGKLELALKRCKSLISSGYPVGKDDVLGAELARSGVYSFRNPSVGVEENLKSEAKKPRSSRGTHTAARDIRRFFLLLGFLAYDPEAKDYFIPGLGEQLLTAQSRESRDEIWKSALSSLELKDSTGAISHPYQILLKLVEARPGIDNFKLMLALEAKDDGAEEFERIVTLSDLEYSDLRNELNISHHQARNAVKILPALARQLRDIDSAKNHSFPLHKVISTEDELELSALGKKREHPRTIREPVAEYEIGKIPEFSDITSLKVDLTEALEANRERQTAHQNLVQNLAGLLAKYKCQLYENPYDCYAIASDRLALLIEVKTLDSSGRDEIKQARTALGQLLAYAYFDIPSSLKRNQLISIAAFGHRPRKAVQEFLLACNIKVAWPDNEQWYVLRDLNRGPELIETAFLE